MIVSFIGRNRRSKKKRAYQLLKEIEKNMENLKDEVKERELADAIKEMRSITLNLKNITEKI